MNDIEALRTAEEQISTLYREHYPDSWMADGSLLRFARAIEAAHGIKEAS
jgi:hypothetical protein